MAVIDWESDGCVGLVRMNNGANLQDPEFVSQMNDCLDQILDDLNIHAVIITSTDEKNFCQGINIDWMSQKMNSRDVNSIKAFLHGMNQVFLRLLLMPVPVIAAVNGHAFGNGALLACACDFRLMKKDKGFFCFPEVDINIPFLPGMIEIIRKAVPVWKLNEMILTGKRVEANELEKHHVIIKACDDDQMLMDEAVAFAKTFKKQRAVFGELKKQMHKNIIKVMESEDVEQINHLTPLDSLKKKSRQSG
jgi:enoyl-CoA hydratase/carnithine racemase